MTSDIGQVTLDRGQRAAVRQHAAHELAGLDYPGDQELDACGAPCAIGGGV